MGDFDEVEVDVEVVIDVVFTCEVEKYKPGKYDGPPELCDPSDGGFEGVVEAQVCVNGKMVKLPPEITKHIVDEYIKNIEIEVEKRVEQNKRESI